MRNKTALVGGAALGVLLACGLGVAAHAQDTTTAWKGAPQFTNDSLTFKVRGRVYIDAVNQSVDRTGSGVDFDASNTRLRPARLGENMDKVKVASINGVRPTAQTISSGAYPLSRSMFIYVKKANLGVTPGLKEFVQEYLSDAATGCGGYLQSRGLIVLPPAQHQAQKDKVARGTPMARPAS